MHTSDVNDNKLSTELNFKNDSIIRAIRKEPLAYTPVWMMRQAGRYLPEYRQLRQRAGSFMNLCQTPELACEVTLQPLERYAFDAGIIFSDILTIPHAMGLGLRFIEGEGPVFSHPTQSEQSIRNLVVPDSTQLAYVYEAIRLVNRELKQRIPLIGFCGSPWTLAAYMIQGRSEPGFPLAQLMMAKEPALLHALLEKLAMAVGMHLAEQAKAGAHIVKIFDTWGGLLASTHYQMFSLAYMQKSIQYFKKFTLGLSVPIILFTKGGHPFLESLAQTDCDMVAVDWQISLAEARARIGHKAIQGNLNPADLKLPEAELKKSIASLLHSYGYGSGHVFNLGHGITPDILPEQVEICIHTVHELSSNYHRSNE